MVNSWWAGGLAAVVMLMARVASADVPDAAWSAAQGLDIVVEKQDGSRVAGKLVSVETSRVVLLPVGGRLVEVDRSAVQALRVPGGGAGEPAEPPPAPGEVPARTGFQMALATGYAHPLGSAGGSLSQSDFVTGQFPLLIEIGGKPTRHLFLGGYLGFGFGGAGAGLASTCSSSGVSCTGLTVRLGVEAQYHILPDQRFNPYVGYGIGFELTAVSASAGDASASFSALGWELGRFTVGGDYRWNRFLGFGPCVSAAVGQYESLSVNSGDSSQSGGIAAKTLHAWLTIGGRVTFLP
jgi:hypothetical protein